MIQEHSFWEIYDGSLANFWDDSWNQHPKLGEDLKWQHIRLKCLEEGREKVNQFREGNSQGERCKWMVPIEPSDQISEADIRAPGEELNTRYVGIKDGVDRLI